MASEFKRMNRENTPKTIADNKKSIKFEIWSVRDLKTFLYESVSESK